ncbi:hypothetical protein PR202_gb12534 [Eleusine coracana subsp. coracana]|uniref:Nodulin-like domain-containing protein n=1 Tax=Eleusine coracana subsp. coracana TaxID=191504 RepID=A0AAV5EQR6_ELECO|nr:hypothetical protein PR202_gb12534 [Eleusine coracana subsp. coracana]
MAFDAGTASSNPLRVILTRRFARQVLTGRWFTVFASILIMASSGATHIFSTYSSTLKSALGYDQHTLNTVALAKDLGASLGLIAGLLNEVAPPCAVLAAGAAANLAGYLPLYLFVSGKTTSTPPIWLVRFCAFVGANAQTFAATGAVVTCVRNFPETRGVVLGLLEGVAALSGAVFTQMYYSFFGGTRPESLVLLVAVLPAAVSVVFVTTVRYMPRRRRRGGMEASVDPFFCFLYLSIALACFLLVMIVVRERVEMSRSAQALAATPLVILMMMPLGVVTKQEYKIRREREVDAALVMVRRDPVNITVVEGVEVSGDDVKKAEDQVKKGEDAEKKAEEHVKETESPPLPAPAQKSCIGRRLGNCIKTTFRAPKRGEEDYTILQAVFSIDMLVLFVSAVCGLGGTLTAIDNMGQIGEALGYHSNSINTFVSLVSIWTYAGRVTAGYASEALLASRLRVPRPLLLTLVLLLACVGHLLLASGAANALYPASVVVGFCFGAQWPLVFAVVSEVFGLKRYSTLYNLGWLACPVGSYLLGVCVAGRLYDAEAKRQGTGGGGVCLGVECYRRAFLIITAATVFGAAVSVVLVWRTWAFYRGDVYARFREGGDGRLPVGQQRLVPEQGKEEEEGAAVNGGGKG